ncbi:hypothetical protein ADUPG1_001396, partial [Aduncisulcus paluster]
NVPIHDSISYTSVGDTDKMALNVHDTSTDKHVVPDSSLKPPSFKHTKITVGFDVKNPRVSQMHSEDGIVALKGENDTPTECLLESQPAQSIQVVDEVPSGHSKDVDCVGSGSSALDNNTYEKLDGENEDDLRLCVTSAVTTISSPFPMLLNERVRAMQERQRQMQEQFDRESTSEYSVNAEYEEEEEAVEEERIVEEEREQEGSNGETNDDNDTAAVSVNTNEELFIPDRGIPVHNEHNPNITEEVILQRSPDVHSAPAEDVSPLTPSPHTMDVPLSSSGIDEHVPGSHV